MKNYKVMVQKKKIQVVSFQSLSATSGAGMARLGYMLSATLNNRGLLSNFIVHSKGKYDTPFKSVPVSFSSRFYLLALNKLVNTFNIPSYKFRLWQEMLFDWFCQWRIKKDTGILFTTNAFMHRTFKRAKKLGIIIVLLPGTPEENYIYELVSEENKRMGIKTIDAYTYDKRVAYFNKSVAYIDKVIGSLPTVYTSYTTANHSLEIIKILGHMTPDFKPATIVPKTTADSFHIGYIAHTVILKGLHYLLDAWKEISTNPQHGNITLHIGGSMDGAMQDYVDKHYAGLVNVIWEGHIADTASFMQKIDVLVVPSLIDGAPMTALEAAHNGVPCIITDHCGSSELLSRNESGCWVIPIRDKTAITERILYAYNNRETTRTVGMNAKQNIDRYSMQKFIDEVADYLEQHI
ncbi:hypothetical protein CAP35_01000 [Chitinophagaceae bacterium IBVUCB1]|nr:hypothetical protein CAP35_01000 [Chitinophagaceae bacterium IBVUCB1]